MNNRLVSKAAAPSRNSSSLLIHLVEILAAAGGLALSVYLAIQHTRLKLGIQGGPSLCHLGDNFDCDAVNNSAYAEVAGIPIALFGGVFYLVLLALAFVALPGQRGRDGAQRVAAGLALLGLLIDVALLGVQLFVIKNFCLFCSATYLCTLVYLIAAVRSSDRKNIRGLLWEDPVTLPPVGISAAALLGSIVIAVALAFIPGVLMPKADPAEEAQVEKWFKEYEALPRKLLPESPDDGLSGPLGAPHQLVIFSDFQCPFCRRAAANMEKALAPYRDQVRVVFKNFPLDSTCNPALSYPLHPHACYLAQLSICAARADKFRAYHDTVFLKLPEDAFTEGRDAINAGINPVMDEASRRKCTEDLSVASALRTSIELGRDLGVKGTPAVFIDGRSIAVQVNERTIARLLK